MTDRRAALLLPLALLAGPVAAETVYRCQQNGSVAFRQSPSDPSCQALDVRADEPDAETAARQRDEVQRWRERRSRTAATKRARNAATRPPDRSRNGNEAGPDITTEALQLPRELDFGEPAIPPDGR